jgi:hypothetical protein
MNVDDDSIRRPAMFRSSMMEVEWSGGCYSSRSRAESSLSLLGGSCDVTSARYSSHNWAVGAGDESEDCQRQTVGSCELSVLRSLSGEG